MLTARPSASIAPPPFAAPIVVRATELDLGWSMPDEDDSGDDDESSDYIALDDADLIDVRPL